MKLKTIAIISIFIALAIILCFIIYYLVWNGVIILNDLSSKKYPIKGIDVSSYQGEIDWEKLSTENISFAFIKATEGSSYVDKKFEYNFLSAQKTSLLVGAYHFFSFDSKGETQAQNFIKTVKPFEGMLPPVIDLEFYGNKENNPPDRAAVEKELKTLLAALEEYYGQKPIIYATEKSYNMYLLNDYKDYDIWIRNVISVPKLSDERKWTFWQYTNRGKLSGYNGEEEFIDINVFGGSAQEFDSYITSLAYRP